MMPLDAAREFLRQGRIADAERAYESALERVPDDVEALTVVGLAALRTNRPERARDLLARAVARGAANALTLQHLGRAQDLAGDAAGAAGSYAAALRLEPDRAVARLQYAALLERGGERDAAAIHYSRALQDAQRARRWLDADSTPEALRPLVEHAVREVRASRRRAYETLVAPLVAKYGRSSLDRVDRCLRVYLCEEHAAPSDPRQQPGFLYFPGLPTSPYLPRAALGYLDALEAHAPAIRAELEALLPSATGRERVFTSDALEAANLGGDAPSWNGYYFWRYGERRADNCAACPRTTAALDALPLCRVRGHGPEVLYSVFTPGTHLLPHRGVTNTRVVGHLPLIVPPGCALNVGGEVHEWIEGRAIAFDDTYEHEAWNRGDRTRVVLIFDLWNPWLTDVERLAIAELVASLGDFRHAVESA